MPRFEEGVVVVTVVGLEAEGRLVLASVMSVLGIFANCR
jgi:hypothetical protein